jgi:hypothetical protein
MADEAIARAKELDAYYKETGKLMGPLVSDLAYRNTRGMSNAFKHGVPISVKEHIGIKGRICHTGYVTW